MATAADQVCLELRNIGIYFRDNRVLNDVTFSLKEQEIVSIIGPNGAGKTTLFNIICGQIRPARGTVLYYGRSITGLPPHRICRSGIARTFQSIRPFPEMTALENVLIGLMFGKPFEGSHKKYHDEGLELLDLVGLSHKAETSAVELTLSEQRRLEIARALATKPRLLLLDEMAAGLSPRAIKQAVELLKTLRSKGLTLLIIDHYLTLTARVSDRLIALSRGEIIMEGAPCDVLECSEVVSAYLGEHRGNDLE